MTTRLWFRFALAAACTLCLVAARADDPKLPPPQKDTLQAVLDRIKQHAAGEAWKQPGFKDDEIEKWLDKLVGSIAKAADIADLTLPVRLQKVSNAPPLRPGSLRGSLVIGKDIAFKDFDISDSIILADGNAVVGVVRNCVVVARGVITIDVASSNSVVVAGIGVQCARDGGQREVGSVLVSRGWVQTSDRATGTVLAAHEGIETSGTSGAIFVNAPVPQPPVVAGGRGFGGGRVGFGQPQHDGSKSVRVPDLPLEALPVHPLAAKLKLQGVLHTVVKAEAGRLTARSRTGALPTALLMQYEGRQYIADLHQPITDEAGVPASALAGWRPIAINKRYVVFSRSDADMVLRWEGK